MQPPTYTPKWISGYRSQTDATAVGRKNTLDTKRFDQTTKLFATRRSRRAEIGLGTAAVAATGLLLTLHGARAQETPPDPNSYAEACASAFSDICYYRKSPDGGGYYWNCWDGFLD